MFIWRGLSLSGDPLKGQEILLWVRQADLQALWDLGNQAALFFGRMMNDFFLPNLVWAMFRAEQATSVVCKSISPKAGCGSSQRLFVSLGSLV